MTQGFNNIHKHNVSPALRTMTNVFKDNCSKVLKDNKSHIYKSVFKEIDPCLLRAMTPVFKAIDLHIIINNLKDNGPCRKRRGHMPNVFKDMHCLKDN